MATILIIDEELVRVLLRSALEAAGYEVTEAANGARGLSCTAATRWTWSSQT
jgi:CheY-like chemotaxis protein